MPQARFLCLAVSRRESGNCIAGLDIDSGNWLRPIRSQVRAAFADSDLIVVDNHTNQNRFMAPLDLLSLPLQDHVPTNSQPENWTVSPEFFKATPTILRRCTGPRTVEFLRSHACRSELLLDSPGDSLHADEIARRKLSHSLALVRPSNLAWRVSPNPKHAGRLQVRAEFAFGDMPYSLVVTDPTWEEQCCHRGIGTHHQIGLDSPGADLLMLTISLAAVPFHGLHYKLVAGVIQLPAFDPVH